jgi:hypothetical protein
MKKLLLLSCILATSLCADPKPFLGANLTYTGGEAIASYQETNVERTKGYEMKMGIEDDIYRVYGDFGKVEWNNSTARTNLLAGELTFPMGNPLGTKRDMKLYMGLHYGIVSFETNLTGNERDRGEMYGMQFGILSPCLLDERGTVEFGFRNSKTNITTQTSTYTHELTSLNSLYLGFNYSF